MNPPAYPPSRKTDHVDTYHGIQVPDPYHWLEESRGQEREAWIAAQNDTTAQYLAGIRGRQELRCRFAELLNYQRHYDFFRRGPYLVFKKNSGLQNQLVLLAQRGIRGKPEILVDPNALASDGTVRLGSCAMSKSARYLAYGLSRHGTEWEEYHIKDMLTRNDLPDRLQWIKASSIAWQGNGFYYSRYPPPMDPTTILTAPHRLHQVWYHRVGTPQSSDRLVYEDPDHPERIHVVTTTADERYVILTIIDRASGHAGGALFLLGGASGRELRQIVGSFDDGFHVVDTEGDMLLVVTTRLAPNRRVVLIDPARPDEREWQEVIEERQEPIEQVSAVGDKLLVVYRADGLHRLDLFDRAGRCERELPLPGHGFAHVVPGQRHDIDVLWSFTSFFVPPIVYRYEFATRTSSVVFQPALRFDAEQYETKRVFYSSKDGSRIPMFLVHRRDLGLDGTSPALLCGYGGYGACMGPTFDPFLPALLERGVVYAVPCLRGGGEYGEAWHQEGWREKKQNTFDDCVAAAEWLQANGYTAKDRCGLIGASHGGLLVGAVMTQRPHLFRVALPCAGPMDMLRFQRFTLAAGSIAEFGSSDDPDMFPVLLAYSPLHNIKEGVTYPATLVTTYEQDDCIVPAHSFKFIATLQELGAASHPYLLRVESNSGHGPVSLPKAIEERVDIYAFLLAHLAGSRPGLLVQAGK